MPCLPTFFPLVSESTFWPLVYHCLPSPSSVLKNLIITYKTPQCTTFWHFFQELSCGSWLWTSSSNKKATRLPGMLQRPTFLRRRHQPSPMTQFPLPLCTQIQGFLVDTWSAQVCVELQLLSCYTSLQPQTPSWLPICRSLQLRSSKGVTPLKPSWKKAVEVLIHPSHWPETSEVDSNMLSLETTDCWQPVAPREGTVLFQQRLRRSWPRGRQASHLGSCLHGLLSQKGSFCKCPFVFSNVMYFPTACF